MMINQYWQVLRTYLDRPRFWVLGVTYLLVTWLWFWYDDWSGPGWRQGQAIISVIFAFLISCFLGLHVRRQFSHPAAQAIPGYAMPHLVSAGFIGACLWLFVPGIACWTGHWERGALAWHACAAVMMGIVACWPRGVLLMLAIPAIAIWSTRPVKARQYPYIAELYLGYHPYMEVALIATAIVVQAVAAWLLLRLPRAGITTNDEFTTEPQPIAVGANPLTDWLLQMRESEAIRLSHTRWLPLVQRWRAPVAIVPLLLFVPAALVAGSALVGWWFNDPATWAWFAIVLCCAILLLLPLGPWQSRRSAMSQEMVRPESRENFFRQFLGAMAIDMLTWTSIASLLIFTAKLANWQHMNHGHRLWDFALSLGISTAIEWSLAAFVFGVGVATLHWRFWLPTVAATTFGWAIVFGAAVRLVSLYLTVKPDRDSGLAVIIFPPVTAAIGLYLTRLTYRRWVRSDVV